jgi:hypothetical protein
MKPEYIIPAHCTGFETIVAFSREMPNEFTNEPTDIANRNRGGFPKVEMLSNAIKPPDGQKA